MKDRYVCYCRVSFLADEAMKTIESKIRECIQTYSIEHDVFNTNDILEIFSDSFNNMKFDMLYEE